jgi:heme/copper-type cytochrome/quinol oxidase subunit 4
MIPTAIGRWAWNFRRNDRRAAMTVPKNVLLFEVLLYLSLVLDSLTLAFQDRTPTEAVGEEVISTMTLIQIGLILLLVFFVWLAARHRKSWPRWALLAIFALSVISLIQVILVNGLELDSAFQLVSCAMTAAGFYFSFTGDAHGWFNA